MGTKKARKALGPTAESEEKTKVTAAAKGKSEIDDIFGQTARVQDSEEKEKEKVQVKAKAKAKSEIDDIFGEKKRKKTEGEDDQAAAKRKERDNSEVVKLNSKGELVKSKKPKAAKPAASGKSTVAAAAPVSRKKTEDGFTVYTAEELGFNKKDAGGSKLCPFDCDCCF